MDAQENSDNVVEIHDVTFQLASTMGVARQEDETLEEAFRREVNEEMTNRRLYELFADGDVSFEEGRVRTTTERYGDVDEIVGQGLPDGAVAIDRADHVDENPRVLVAVDSRDEVEVAHDEETHTILAVTPTEPCEPHSRESEKVGQADD